MQARAVQAQLGGRLRGRLRVASYPSVAREFVGDALIAFGRRHPEVEIEFDECAPIDVEEAVRDGRADVGFALLPSADELIAFEVDRAACVAVVPSGWRGDRIERDDLARTPFLVYGDPVCERVILGYVRGLVGPMEPALRLHETATILSMVARGRGISIVTPDSLVGQSGVRAAELPAPLLRLTGAVVRPESLAVPTVKAFLASLRRSGRIPVDLPAARLEPGVAAD